MATEQENIVIGLSVKIEGDKDAIRKAQREANEYNKALKEIGETHGKNSQEYKDAKKSLDAHNQSIKDASLDLKDLQVEYSKAKKEAGETQSIFSKFDDAIGGVGSSFIALATNPIVLTLTAIVAGFKFIIDSMKRTEEGSTTLNKIFGALSATMSVIADMAGKIGMTLVKAFEDPKQALVDFGNFLYQNLVNRVVGAGKLIVDTFKMIGNAMVFDWDAVSEGAKDVANDFLQISTGVEDVIGKTKELVTVISEEAKKRIELNNKLEDSKNRLAKIERDNAVEQAKREKELAVLKENVEKIDKYTIIERLKMMQKAMDVQDDILNQQEYIAKEKARIHREELVILGKNKDTLAEQAELDANVFRVQKENFERRTEFTTKYQSLLTEQFASFMAQETAKINIMKSSLGIYEQANKSKLKSDKDYLKGFYDSGEDLVKQEKDRLIKVRDEKLKINESEKQVAYAQAIKNKTDLEAVYIDFNNREIAIKQASSDAISAIDQARLDKRVAQRIADEQLLAQHENEGIQAKFERDLAASELEYQMKVESIDRLAIEGARGYQNEKEVTDKKLALAQEYARNKMILEVQTASMIAGVAQNLANNLAGAMEGHAKAQKAMQIASATIGGIKGALDAYLGMISTIPGPVGIALGAVSAAAVAVSTGLQIRKMMAVNTKSTAQASPTFQAPSIPSLGSSNTSSNNTQSSNIQSTNANVGNGIVSRSTEQFTTNQQNNVQTVLVVDDVTFNQTNISDNKRISTL